MTDTLCVHLNNVAHQIYGVDLFMPVSFDLKTGQAVLIKGDNGAGKSTLLRMIAGLLPVSRGLIQYSNNISPQSNSIHLLGHHNGLKDGETVTQNLAYWHKMTPRTSEKPPPPIYEIAAKLNISSLLPLPIKVLSAGQKRRLAFARLLLDRRPLWLLDEPTASLDMASCKAIEAITVAHLAQGGGVITATHLPFLTDVPDATKLTLILERPSSREEAPVL